MTLYEIKQQYLDLLNKIANDEIPEDAVSDTLEAIEGDLHDKVDNIACYIKSLEAEKDAIKKEVDNLMLRMSKKTIKINSLTAYLDKTMKDTATTKIETSRNVISIKKNPPSVVLDDGFVEWAKKDHNYLLRIKYSEEPDKQAIKEMLASCEIPFARLEVKERLVIK